VREFGCLEDDGRFERLLTVIGTNRINPRMIPKSRSGALMALGFAEPARGDLEGAMA